MRGGKNEGKILNTKYKLIDLNQISFYKTKSVPRVNI
jgi:hypothetical protein